MLSLKVITGLKFVRNFCNGYGLKRINFNLLLKSGKTFSRRIKIASKSLALSDSATTINPQQEELVNNRNEIEEEAEKLSSGLVQQMHTIINKNQWSSTDEDSFFKICSEVNKLPIKDLNNKFFGKAFTEKISRFRLNSQRNISVFLKFLERFDFALEKQDIEFISKKIILQLNFLDPDSVITALSVEKKYNYKEFPALVKIFQLQVERFIKQYSAEKLTKLLYLLSQSNEDNHLFLCKINREINLKIKEENEKLSKDDVYRLTFSFLNKFSKKYSMVHPNLWIEINNIFGVVKEIEWPLASYSLYLLAKANYYDKPLFDRLEKAIFDKLLEHRKRSADESETIQELQVISKIMCSYAIAEKGSFALWNEYFELCDVRLDLISKEFISNFLETLTKKGFVLRVFRENDLFQTKIREIIRKIVERIESIYIIEGLMGEDLEENSLISFCEKVIKSGEFSEKFTDLCVAVLKSIHQGIKKTLNNSL